MAAWPEVDDVAGWLRTEAIGTDGDDEAILAETTAAATATVRSWLDTSLLPVDPADCPEAVRIAIIMRSAAVYVRRSSPQGVVSFSEDTVFRVSRWDADVTALVAPYRAAMVG